MIILDTNVVSELMKPVPDPVIVTWFSGLERTETFLTAVTSYEIRFGIARLDAGARRDRLLSNWTTIKIAFQPGSILPLDHGSAERAADFRAVLVSQGINGTDICDLLIAGIAATHGAAVATRNVRHFDDLPLALVDPWSA